MFWSFSELDADTLIRRLDALGITMKVSGRSLELRPGSRVPRNLHDEIRRHKLDLLNRLARQPSDSELIELVRTVNAQGYVLLWSNVLRDTIAFVKSYEDAGSVPRHFTIYTVDELMEIFGDQTPSPSSLKLIHEAKKHGGRITGEGQ